MAIKMKKTDLVIAALVVAVVLAGVLTGLAACQNSTTESLLMPLNLPTAEIVDFGTANSRFALTWKYADGLLPASANYNDPVALEHIQQVYDEWNNYEKLTDPRPHFIINGALDYEVFGTGGTGNQIDNTDPSKSLRINRCWPQGVLERTPNPTQDDWEACFPARVAEFKQAVKDIRSMMAALEKSPLYLVEINSVPLLKQVHDMMRDRIVFPTDPDDHHYQDRTEFDIQNTGVNRAVWIDLSKSSIMYEYYFGYTPKEQDYKSGSLTPPFPW